MLPAGGKPSPQAIVEHRDASIGAAEPARRQGRASFEDPGLFSRQVPPPGAPVPSGSPPPRPSSAEAVGGAREGGKSPGTGAGRRRRSEESLSASQSHQSVGRVLAGRPGTEGSGRRVGAWEGVIESGAGQEVASVEAWGAEVGEGVRRSEGGGVAGPGGAGGKSPLKKGTTVRRRASSGFELGSLWAQDGADGPQSPPQAAHAPPSAQGTPSGGAAFLTDDSEAGLVSGVMDRTPRSSETQRRESSGIQGPLRGGQSPEPSPAFVRRHDAADRVRGFFEARAAPSPSPSPSPPPARVPSASLPPAGPSKGAARFAVHVASATPLDASTTPPRRSDAANALSVSPDGASALLVSPGDRGGPSARDGRGSRDRSGPVEDAESRGGTAYSLGSLASGKGPGTPSGDVWMRGSGVG